MDKFYIENENASALVANIVKVDAGLVENLIEDVNGKIVIVTAKAGTLRDLRIIFTDTLEDAMHFNSEVEAEEFADVANAHNDKGDKTFMVSSGDYVVEKFANARVV